MYWLYNLFFGDTLAHTIFVLALVITVGILLGKIKIGGVSLGTTWILFVGIAASHFGMTIDPGVLSFIKEFGLILFVFSIDRKSTRLNSSHPNPSRMPSSA